MHHRFVLVDVRYSFIHTRFAGSGGNARQRSAQRHAAEIRYFKYVSPKVANERKWRL